MLLKFLLYRYLFKKNNLLLEGRTRSELKEEVAETVETEEIVQAVEIVYGKP